jgi:hypothetical protein
MKSTPTSAKEVLQNVTPLDLLVMVEERMALYRLQIFKQQKFPRTVSRLLTIWKNARVPLVDMRSLY